MSLSRSSTVRVGRATATENSSESSIKILTSSKSRSYRVIRPPSGLISSHSRTREAWLSKSSFRYSVDWAMSHALMSSFAVIGSPVSQRMVRQSESSSAARISCNDGGVFEASELLAMIVVLFKVSCPIADRTELESNHKRECESTHVFEVIECFRLQFIGLPFALHGIRPLPSSEGVPPAADRETESVIVFSSPHVDGFRPCWPRGAGGRSAVGGNAQERNVHSATTATGTVAQGGQGRAEPTACGDCVLYSS